MEKVQKIQEERGVTAVLGAMLIFLIIATMWGIIQAYHVPLWNEDVEYEHLDEIYDDLVTLKSDIEDVASLKVPKTSDVRMGVRYPGRAFLANPGAGVSGSLTSEDVAVSIEYTLDGLGDPVITENYTSNRISYEALGTIGSPSLVYEHGLLVKDYGGGEYATVDDQSLVVDSQIFVPLLLGSLTSPSSMETEPVALKPLSGSNVRSNIKSVKITLDTNYPDVWEQLLSGVGSGGGGGGPTSANASITDDFESGGWTGGSGWLGDWSFSGDAVVTGADSPHGGSSFHLRLQRGTGYAERAADLSTATSARLQFWAKASSFETGEQAYALVSSDHTNWDVVHTWVEADADGIYYFYDIDLAGFTLSSEFWVAFQADMGQPNDDFYIDDLEIVYTYPVGSGGGGSEVVTVTGGQVIIESSNIKQIELPAGDITADALYAGMAVFRTTAEAVNFSSIDTSQDYPAILDISITAGTIPQTQSTITLTVRNTTSPYEVHANLTDLTNDPATQDVFPDYSSPDSIAASSWTVPNENTVSWTDVNHPDYDVGDAFIVQFWVTNSENGMQFVTYRVFQRQSQVAWY